MFALSNPFDTLTQLIAAALATAHSLVTRLGLPADGSLGWMLAVIALVAAVRVALLPVVAHGVRLAHAGARARPHLRELQQRYAGRTDPDSLRELLAALVASAGSATVLGVSLADRWGDAVGHSAGHALVVVALASLAAALSYLTQRYAVLPNQVLDGLPDAFAQAQRAMPALSAVGILVGAVAVPVGLLVYWVANNAFTLVQQGVVTRYAPTPGSAAYAGRAARLARRRG